MVLLNQIGANNNDIISLLLNQIGANNNDIISLFVNFSCELGQIMTIYDFLWAS